MANPVTATTASAASRAAHTNPQHMLDHYTEVRDMSLELAKPLSPEDCMVQSMLEASPTKWHLAHSTWFFETFILKAHARDYREFHEQFSYLYNSYYNKIGERMARHCRGHMTRPSLDDVLSYREHVDGEMTHLLEHIDPNDFAELAPLITIGLNHEQQHQELLITDVKHLLSLNPLEPVYKQRPQPFARNPIPPMEWIEHPGGMIDIGYDDDGFCFDNEQPRHRALLEPFALATRPVTNGEFLQFIEDDGYKRAELWLDMAWAHINDHKWTQPIYWRRDDRGEWYEFTMAGAQPLDMDAPLTCISLYEADAYARWAGANLPTEQQWEAIAAHHDVAGNLLEARRFHPMRAGSVEPSGNFHQLFGDVWEWTASQYRPYPGYTPPAGAIGEYNGKFMCNQFVLRGGSCATPASHLRATYRNFFPPESRWQFAGVRLAKDRNV